MKWGMDMQGGDIHQPPLTRYKVSFCGRKDEVIKQKSTTHRDNCMERCD